MRRAHLARTIITDYHKRIQECEKHKKDCISYLQKIKDKCLDRELNFNDYEHIIKEEHKGKTIPQWIEYYEAYASECLHRIKKEEKALKLNNFLAITSSIFILALLILFILYAAPAIVGFITKKSPQIESFSQPINFTTSKSTILDWQPENIGQLRSLKVSGIVEGSGNVKIYLDNLLILNSSRLSSSQAADSNFSIESSSPITGLLLENSPQDEQPSTEQSLSNTQAGASEEREVSPSQQKPLPETISTPIETQVNETSSEIIPDQSTNNNQTASNQSSFNETILNETITNETRIPEDKTIPKEQTSSNETTPYNESIIQPPYKKISFANICEETCDLESLLLNKSSYKIRIELEENTSLYLYSINYEILQEETKKPIKKQQNETLEKINITTYKSRIVIDKPVKWKKRIEFLSQNYFSINLSEEVSNISVKKINKRDNTFRDLPDKKDKKRIDLMFNDSSEAYEIEYETPAPRSYEENLTRKKRVRISAPDELNYTDVLSFTSIPETITVSNKNKIKVLWVENNSLIDFNASDTNNNSLIDYIEWTIDHLSNQTFEIILITKAEHLDENHTFISDIYEQVKSLDNIWSEEIKNNEYVRVTFEKNLTSKNDITIYPRIIKGNPTIEVYEINKSEIVAEFSSLSSNRYNQVFLSSLQNSQDAFDLKIKGGSIELDHIIDPAITNVLLPSNKTQNVTIGIFTENTYTFQNNSRIDDVCYSALNISGGSSCMAVGTPTRDAYVLWNMTLPNYTVIVSVNITVTMANTANTDRLNVSLWNFSASKFQTVAGVTTPGANVNITFVYNITSAFFSSFISGRNIRLLASGTGGTTDNIRVDYMVAVVDFYENVSSIVTINDPQNTTYSSFPIPFNVTLDENGTYCNYTLDDGRNNKTMSTIDTFTYNASNSSMAEISYTARFICSDLAGNVNSTAKVVFSVANAPPSISIVTPLNNTIHQTYDVNVNYTVSDDALDSCWYTNTTGVVNYTITCGVNLTSKNWIKGINNVTIYAKDTSGNENSSAVTFTIDLAPNVTLYSPADGANVTTEQVTFICNATEDSGLVNSTLYFGSTGGSSTIALVQNTTTIVASAASTITCTLGAATAGNLLVTTVASDKTAGTYTAPSGFTIINSTSATSISGAIAYKIAAGGETAIQWNQSTASGTGGVSCWAAEYSGTATSNVLDVGAENETASSGDTIGTSLNTGLTGTTSQADELAIAFVAIDTATSCDGSRSWSNGFSEFSFRDTGAAGGVGMSVSNKTLSSTGTQITTYSCTGDTGDQMYAAIATFKAANTIAWHANQTINITGTSNSTTFYKNLTTNLNYLWNCFVADDGGNTAFASSNFTFNLTTTVDNPPNVALNSPANDTTSTSLTINFNFTASDDNNLTNATLYFCNVTTSGSSEQAIAVNWIVNRSTWYYNDSNVSVPSNWMNTSGYLNWPSGPSYLATSAETAAPGVNTTLKNGSGPIAFPTYYFMRNFTITNASNVINMTFGIDYDDAYMVWINGFEMNTSNSSCDWYTHGTFCQSAHNSEIDSTGATAPNRPRTVLTATQLGYLITGINNISVAIKGNVATSSDIAFELVLFGYENQTVNGTQQCSSSFSANKTITIYGTTNITNITQIMADNQTYWWNIYVCDSASQCSFNNTNFTLYVNTSFTEAIPPIVTIVSPQPQAYGQNYINFNVTLDENGDTCLYTLTNGATNYTMTKASSTKFGAANSSISDESYKVNYYCNDTSGNLNITASVNFSINHGAKRVILIGVDGMQYQHYVDMLQNNQLTNFSSMVNNRGWNGTHNITGHAQTVTAPGNAEFHTGLNSTLTGIVDNTCDVALPDNNSTFERLKLWNSSIATGSIYGKETCYLPDEILLNTKAQVNWWQNRTTYSPTAWSDGTACDNSKDVATKATEFIGNYSNSSFYLFVYFGVPDCSGHAAGDNSVNYNNSFINVDDGLGILLKSLRDNGINDSTQILTTSDHGWNEGTTGHSTANADTIVLPLVTNNASLVEVYGNNDNVREQCELAPTVLDYFGIPQSNWSDITGNGCGSMISSVNSSAPTILYVTNVSLDNTINPAEDTFVNIMFNFTVYDPNGTSDLVDTTARANFTGSGLPVRQNNTCTKLNTFGSPVNYANYTCIIPMWYFDFAGTWNISVAINDTSNSVAINSTKNFTFNTLTAFKMAPTSVTFVSINPGSTNTTANNDPVLLNNTGNVVIAVGSIQVNATDLKGETDNTRAIYAGNITIANNTLPANAECDFTGNNNASLMLTSKYSIVNLTSLSRGNNSLNYANETSGQEQLYVCIQFVGNELSAQSYSTSNQGAWTIKIAIVALSLRVLRKKKEIKKDKLFIAINLIAEELQVQYSQNKKEALYALLKEITIKYQISRKEALELIESERKVQEGAIPITIFRKELGGLEALCKYLKENLGMTYHEIAIALKRNDRTVWTAYRKAKKKLPSLLDAEESSIIIPLNILGNRNLTILESVISYLKNLNMRYSEIALMLKRDQRNIWTIHNRAIKKLIVALSIRILRKKKEIKKDKLFIAINLIAEELQVQYSQNKKEALYALLKEITIKYQISRKEALELIESERKVQEGAIPITIFRKELGGLEALCKYLKENLNMRYSEIALMLKRDQRTVWSAYRKAKKKLPSLLDAEESSIIIPLNILGNRNLTILESTISYLKNLNMRYSEIALMLKRDQRNIWTIHNRAIKKLIKRNS